MIGRRSSKLFVVSVAVLPMSLTGVDIAYRLKSVNRLNLSGPVIAAIFNGRTTRWDDPGIKALNPKAKLPGTKISVAYPGAASLKVAALENAAGNFVAPSVESFSAAGATVRSLPARGIVEVDYAVGPGSTLGEAVGIAPLPKAVKSAARTAIGAL